MTKKPFNDCIAWNHASTQRAFPSTMLLRKWKAWARRAYDSGLDRQIEKALAEIRANPRQPCSFSHSRIAIVEACAAEKWRRAEQLSEALAEYSGPYGIEDAQ